MALPDLFLQPLPYHRELAAYLETAEREAWAWFASAQAQSDYAEELRVELLKQTYRLDAALFPELFASLDAVRAMLTPDVPVTLYQSQRGREPNASIFCLPGEAHIVFEGNVLQLLDHAELRGVLGHELAHYRLWNESSGRYLVADRLAQAMAVEARAEPSHVETARLLRLYTEIYADRGALHVTGEPGPVISGLVKIQTGLTQVDAMGYIKQANEIFERAKVRTEEPSHPEAFVRARAVSLWARNEPDADAVTARMIQGTAELEKLDLLGQQRLTDHSLRWLRLLLRAPWFQTDAVRGHARLFFPHFEFAHPNHSDPTLFDALRDAPASVRDYFCFLLLDFAAVDPELDDEPLKVAHQLAQPLGWDDRLEALSVRELKIKKREAKRVRDAALSSIVPPAGDHA